jgi:hypothetical protein
LCQHPNMLSLFGQHAFQIFFQEKEAPIVGQWTVLPELVSCAMLSWSMQTL